MLNAATLPFKIYPENAWYGTLHSCLISPRKPSKCFDNRQVKENENFQRAEFYVECYIFLLVMEWSSHYVTVLNIITAKCMTV